MQERMRLIHGTGFVLVVDEEVLMRGVDLDILQRIGYTVIMANSRERLGTTPAAVT
jgi:hypothetical protein